MTAVLSPRSLPHSSTSPVGGEHRRRPLVATHDQLEQADRGGVAAATDYEDDPRAVVIAEAAHRLVDPRGPVAQPARVGRMGRRAGSGMPSRPVTRDVDPEGAASTRRTTGRLPRHGRSGSVATLAADFQLPAGHSRAAS